MDSWLGLRLGLWTRTWTWIVTISWSHQIESVRETQSPLTVLTKFHNWRFMRFLIWFFLFSATIPKCGSCGGMILDRFILKVVDQPWHAKCLSCSSCAQPLRDKCFVKNNEVFCREDFFRKYGTKCSGCGEGIAPSSVVRRAQDNVYHVDCFMCVLCNRKLDTGDEFYLMEDKKLLCKQDYDSAKAKGKKIRSFFSAWCSKERFKLIRIFKDPWPI